MRPTAAAAAAALAVASCVVTGCASPARTVDAPIQVSLSSGPNNLDPRIGTDDASARVHQLLFDGLVDLDEQLRVRPRLALAIAHPDPLTYVVPLRRGVRFHDGHELTSADVVYTFRSMLAPSFVSPRKGGYRELASVDATDRYTVTFHLTEPLASFPINLTQPIVPDGASATLREHPIGTGPYRFISATTDDRITLEANPAYFDGSPRNSGLVLRIIPDDVMRGLELRKGSLDLVINDLAPDIVQGLRTSPRLQVVEAPGVDYQYLGINLRDPALADRRVRQALAFAVDRDAIVAYLRRGLAVRADQMLPALSWAALEHPPSFPHDPARAVALLESAGYSDPDGSGPAPRLRLTLKMSNAEFNRLQGAVLQQQLAEVGIALDVRLSEFATLYADVLAGNFQLFTLQWAAGALADPDILRRVFHSRQAPPAGFNRGHYVSAAVDASLDRASATEDPVRRYEAYAEAQRLIAEDVPYVSLWHKRNVVVGQATLSGLHLHPLGDYSTLRDVARRPPSPATPSRPPGTETPETR